MRAQMRTAKSTNRRKPQTAIAERLEGRVLLASAEVSGTVFWDQNGDQLKSNDEQGLSGFLVYVDLNINGVLDAEEPVANSGLVGGYALSNLSVGEVMLGIVTPPGWTGQNPVPVTLAADTILTKNLPMRPPPCDNPLVLQGDSVQVNPTNGEDQVNPSVAADAEGNYVVVWASNREDGSGWGIYGQRYDSDDARVGLHFRVNATTASDQLCPSVAMARDGSFVVVWQSDGQDGSGSGIVGRRFGADARPLGGEFAVNTITLNDQVHPRIAMDRAGRFVVVWASLDADAGEVYMRRFGSDGTALDNEELVNPSVLGSQWDASIGMNAAGDFVIAYVDSHRVFARRYPADGAEPSTPLDVGAYEGVMSVTAPGVAVASDGSFIISWIAAPYAYPMARRYDASGSPLAGEFALSIDPDRASRGPILSLNDDGSFVACWATLHCRYVLQCRFSASNLGGEVAWVGQTYGQPAMAVLPDGGFVISWNSVVTGFDADVYMQRSVVIGGADPVLPSYVHGSTYLHLDEGSVSAHISEYWPPMPRTNDLRANYPIEAISTIGIYLAGSDRILIDSTNGVPIPSGGLHFYGSHPNGPVNWIELPSTISIADFDVTLHDYSFVAVEFGKTYRMLDLRDASLVVLPRTGTGCFRVRGLSIGPAATIDLNNNSLVVQAGDTAHDDVLADVQRWIRNARGPNASWTGTGIASYAAWSDQKDLTGLGAIVNKREPGKPVFSTFGGFDVGLDDVLVRYTWSGDANLDGLVNADDYFNIDSGFITQKTGWFHGDFNYDTVINADDYFLIDSAYLAQTGPLALSQMPTPATNQPYPADPPAAPSPTVLTRPAAPTTPFPRRLLEDLLPDPDHPPFA